MKPLDYILAAILVVLGGVAFALFLAIAYGLPPDSWLMNIKG